MQILILGARSPAALEWTRAFATAQHSVFVADSLNFALTRFSRHIQRYLKLPAAAQFPNTWLSTLIDYIQKYKIDYLLPTCEEVFYCAHFHKQISRHCTLLCSPLDLLNTLHNKFSFAQFSQDFLIQAPETLLVSQPEQVSSLNTQDYVLKPVYSRFADQTLIRPTAQKASQIQCSVRRPWVAQRYIKGTEFCSFSIMQHGKLLAHCCYQPTYRIGQGAGILLTPQRQQKIEAFLHQFAQRTQLTGQVAFDYMEDTAQEKLYLLECNPRSTSGIHLFTQPTQLVDCLMNNTALQNAQLQTRCVSLALLPYFFSKHITQKTFWQNLRQASDVVWDKQDPLPSLAQFISASEILATALINRKAVLSTTTVDIEWNGQDIV
ncbi:ATP-grasp domain-containing protein [Pseudomonas sp. F1_0610]|uniref:ATP-grasp domain-containing protein n=1 Tax=Pseudomonas sp. F1_0610 TaxID=3114284 RepID=UPI0039C2D194